MNPGRSETADYCNAEREAELTVKRLVTDFGFDGLAIRELVDRWEEEAHEHRCPECGQRIGFGPDCEECIEARTGGHDG